MKVCIFRSHGLTVAALREALDQIEDEDAPIDVEVYVDGGWRRSKLYSCLDRGGRLILAGGHWK